MNKSGVDNLSRLIRRFESSEEASQESRKEADRARDYYDGKQLTGAEMAALQQRKQPPVIENLIRPKIDYLCGLERQTRTDPSALPRTLKDEGAAQIATDVLRYVADDQKLDIKRSHVFQNMLIEGYGGVEVGAKQTRSGIDPTLTWIAWDRLFIDPHSSKPDFSDAAYMGYVTWMDLDDAKRRWPDAQKILDAALAKPTTSMFDTYDDKPKWAYWADSSRNRIRIVTIYCNDNGWKRGVFTLSGEIEPYGDSPYHDEDGQPDNPLVLASAYIDRENDRYGIIRDLITLQDEVNKRRSKYLHFLNSRQVRVSRMFEGSKENARAELAKPDGIIVADAGEVEVIGTGDLAVGHFNLLAEAKMAIQSVGPNATMQGKDGNGQSGRAILAIQQGGMTEMAPLLDALRDWSIRVYRACWNRVRQFWDGERFIRITDDEKAAQFFVVNTNQATVAAMKIKKAVADGQIDGATAQQYMSQIQMDPAMMQPANTLAEMDIDIQIDEIQSSPTLQIEQFEQLSKMAQAGIPIPPEVLIQAAPNLRDKDKLLEMLEKAKSEAAQAQEKQAPVQEAMLKTELDNKAADTEKKLASASLDMAKAQEVGFQLGVASAFNEIPV